jgi:hypothetical protein
MAFDPQYIPLGVPALLSGQGASFLPPPQLLLGDALHALGINLFSQWGIFDQSGNPVILGDTVVAFEHDPEARITNFPVEGGGFESYNKTQVPFDVMFSFTKGGSVAARAEFLASIDAALASLDLLVGITPEKSYNDINVKRAPLVRTSQSGVTLLTVNVYCQQVRVSVPATLSSTPTTPLSLDNAQNPEAASPTNDGTVQGLSPISQTNTQATGQSPGLVQTPNSTLTNSTGSQLPAPVVNNVVGSTIVYDGRNGPTTGVVASVPTSNPGLGYNLTDNSFVGTNLVRKITPPGATAVQ